jgi:adenosylcobinamide-GDP ribazoletransferase
LFPLVGAGLGGISVLGLKGLAGLGHWVSAVAVTALLAYVTGAFHEDGLADTADALGGQVSRERALEIMKDSRIGSYGTVALLLTLFARVALLARLGTSTVTAIVAYGMLARVVPIWLMTLLPHANPRQGKIKDLQQVPLSRAYLGTLVALLLSAALAWNEPGQIHRLGLACVAALLVALWFARLAKRRLGGITGDVLGASEQMAELAVLMVFAWQST